MLKNQDVSSTIQHTQRNAIYIGLTSILTEEQANAALQTWSTYFNDSTSVFNGLNSFSPVYFSNPPGTDLFKMSPNSKELIKLI